jgi:hypothetical protein
MIFLLGVLLGLGLAPQDNRLQRLELRVQGPLSEVRLDCGSAGATLWRGEILGGESRVLTLPVPVSKARAGELKIEVRGGGSAEVESWLLEHAPLPRFLHARALSGPRPPVRRLGLSAALMLVLAGVGGLGLRRRPLWALVWGSAGALALVLLPRTEATSPGALRIFEGQREGQTIRWLRTDAGIASLILPEETSLLRVLTPALAPGQGRTPINFTVDDGGSGGAGGAGLIRVSTPAGTRLAGSFECRRLMGILQPDILGFGSLTRVWSRGLFGGGDDPWIHHGPWALGTALPAPLPGPAPPGWLSAGLPQGRGILLAQVAGTGPGGGDPRAESVWVRMVGFGELGRWPIRRRSDR